MLPVKLGGPIDESRAHKHPRKGFPTPHTDRRRRPMWGRPGSHDQKGYAASTAIALHFHHPGVITVEAPRALQSSTALSG